MFRFGAFGSLAGFFAMMDNAELCLTMLIVGEKMDFQAGLLLHQKTKDEENRKRCDINIMQKYLILDAVIFLLNTPLNSPTRHRVRWRCSWIVKDASDIRNWRAHHIHNYDMERVTFERWLWSRSWSCGHCDCNIFFGRGIATNDWGDILLSLAFWQKVSWCGGWWYRQ